MSNPNQLLCQREPTQCDMITRSIDVMERHWREAHGWTVPCKRGRPSRPERQQAQVAIRRGYRIVTCQRVFPSRYGSHYIQVWRPSRHDEPGPPDQPDANNPPDQIDQPDQPAQRNRTQVIHRLMEEMEEQFQTEQQQQADNNQPGELDEANPWLRRTQWPQHLQDIDHKDLVASIAEPEDSPDPVEARARVIWRAMDRMVRVSQMAVMQVGHQLRIEAIRSERHQNQYRPLQAYMDQEAIVKHMRPWQQIMMFFVCTQAPHEWESPAYRFTARQSSQVYQKTGITHIALSRDWGQLREENPQNYFPVRKMPTQQHGVS